MRHPQVGGLVILVGMAVSSAATAADPIAVTVKNASSRPLAHVYVSPAGADDWSADALDGEVVPVGGRFELPVPSCVKNDVKLVDTGGRDCIIAGLEFCDGVTAWVLTNDDFRGCTQ